MFGEGTDERSPSASEVEQATRKTCDEQAVQDIAERGRCRGLARNDRRARRQKHSPQPKGKRICCFISEYVGRRTVNRQV